MVDILTHVKDEHLQEPEITDINYSTLFSFYKRTNGSGMYRYSAPHILGNLFIRWNTMNDFLYITLLLVGEEEDGSKFTYEITLNSTDGVERISAHQRCRSYLQIINDQFFIKKNRTLYCVPYPMVQYHGFDDVRPTLANRMPRVLGVHGPANNNVH
ncbi:hypothetical protein C0J52_06555 [Blattella germanica]|nr:hypothetical protein C0J52_06555 [Blattella germanica]